jgi:hypothetical protein
MTSRLRFLVSIAALLAAPHVMTQPIEERFFGQNAWYTVYTTASLPVGQNPFVDSISDVQASGATFVRIGGANANILGNNPNAPVPIDKDQILYLVQQIRAAGMEPIIQVPYPNDLNDNSTLLTWAQNAGDIVNHINNVNAANIVGGRVTHWIIANEPDKDVSNGHKIGYNYNPNLLSSPANIAKYIRQFAIEMRKKDVSIFIIGPELAAPWHHLFFGGMYNSQNFNGLGLLSGPNDISGLIGTVDEFGNTIPANIQQLPYINYVSLHYYGTATSRADVLDDLYDVSDNWKIRACLQNLYAACVSSSMTAKRNSIPLRVALTEANLDATATVTGIHGTASDSYLRGQWWCDLAGVALSERAAILNFWSSTEATYGFMDVTGTKRSTYHHYKMMAESFRSTPGNPATFFTNSTPDTSFKSKAFAYKNSNEIGVLILNQAETSTNPWHFDDDVAIDLNGAANPAAIRVSLATGVAGTYYCRIKTETSALIKFDLSGAFISRTEYSIDDTVNNLSPKTWQSPNAYIADGNTWGSTDTGIEPYYGNAWDLPFSEDIWCRNWVSGGYTESAANGQFTSTATDGGTPHQSPDWTTNAAKVPRFFVRLNIPCGGPPVSGVIELYQKESTTTDVYLANWTLIGTAPVTNAAAGEYVVQIDWSGIVNIPQPPSAGQDYCVVARFVSNDDPMFWERIDPDPGATAGNNIKFNNNVAQRNIQLVDGPNNNFVLHVGNALPSPAVISFEFVTPTYPPSGRPFTDAGTINVDLGRTLYDHWVKGGSVGTNVIAARREKRSCCFWLKKPAESSVSPYSIDITGPAASIGNIRLGPDEVHNTELTFNYTASNPRGETYSFDVRQFSDGGYSGAVRYLITPSDCRAVNAGRDVTIGRNCSTTLSASPFMEGAVYTWSNHATGAVVGTGQTVQVSPHASTTYQVQTKSPDGCIMVDAVTVTVNPTQTCRVVEWNPNSIAFIASYETDRYTNIGFSEDFAQWDLDTTTIGGEYRPLRLALGDGIIDPSVRLGVGKGDAALEIAGRRQFDSDVTVVTGGVGLHWTHWKRWGSDLDIGYRKALDNGTTTLVSGTTTLVTAHAPTENSVDFSAIDATLSVRYGLIPDCLTASVGVRTTQGDLTLQQEAGDFFFRRSADVDRRQFIAGAEVRVTRRLSANVEFGTGEGRYTAVSLRYEIGRGRRVAASAPAPER